jgi:hypothetical protein
MTAFRGNAVHQGSYRFGPKKKNGYWNKRRKTGERAFAKYPSNFQVRKRWDLPVSWLLPAW